MLMIAFKLQILVMQAGEAIHKALLYILMTMVGTIGMALDGDGDGITLGAGILDGVGIPDGVGMQVGVGMLAGAGMAAGVGMVDGVGMAAGDTQAIAITIMHTIQAEEALDTLTEITSIEPTTTAIVKM